MVPNTTIISDHPFLDASEYSNSTPNNQNKGLYFPSTDLTKWMFKTENLDGITFPTAFNGMMVYNTGSGRTLTDASRAGQTVTVEPGFYYFYNPNNAEGTSIANGYWKAFNAGDAPAQPWYDAATQTQATDNTQNIYQMGRVGVYTQNPDATLQIQASGQADQPDGLLIPRILLSDLQTKDTAYDVAQNATLIYVINDLGNGLPVGPPGGGVGGVGPGGPASKADYVLESGFYYYDANDLLWKALQTKASNGLTQTLYNEVKLGGQLTEATNITGTSRLTFATPTTISGELKISSGTPGTGKVLTSDTTGNASWVVPSNWSLQGNQLTGTEFIGSTNDVDLVFKRNNIIAGAISTRNTSFGQESLLNNTSGYGNVAIGRNALKENTTGADNISIGHGVLGLNTIGDGNIAIGGAMIGNITGSRNIALGPSALYLNPDGNDNIALGFLALRNNKSNGNIAIGMAAMMETNFNENNIAIGLSSRVSEGVNNSIVIGTKSKATISDVMILGSINGENGYNKPSTKVGIGTTAPVTSLQIDADTTDNTRADALIVPRMTRVQLQAKDNAYGTEQDGAMVFVTVINGSVTTKTNNITSRGFYYYDAPVGLWKSFCACQSTPPVI
ncbi:hypothetical protein [Myroides odoratus]|uniref:hypothetical protein n=1 Tax=Myroides odoratus TaxID=256 RepID=UPI0012E35225|nr:hypothetical protein [Myroides odoratus]